SGLSPEQQTFLEQQVEATAGLNTGNAEGFDPNLFLKILTATLSNQSPFDTMDTQEILNTQARLTQVEQISKQTDHISDMKDTLESEISSINTTLAGIQSAIAEISEKL
ncbi:MAG: hypothetical protein OXU45_02130, partial [Candidatus Melainabacteria bacterium]|nr:hypothetical protein [Candidatus Melainabacteria bacterium]